MGLVVGLVVGLVQQDADFAHGTAHRHRTGTTGFPSVRPHSCGSCHVSAPHTQHDKRDERQPDSAGVVLIHVDGELVGSAAMGEYCSAYAAAD